MAHDIRLDGTPAGEPSASPDAKAGSIGEQPADLTRVETPKSMIGEAGAPTRAASMAEAVEAVQVAARSIEEAGKPELRNDVRGRADAVPARTSVLDRIKAVPLPTAAVALAAVLGLFVGASATSGLAHLFAAPPAPSVQAASPDDIRVLRDTVARLSTDVTALKASVEAASKASNTQFSKLGERVADPTAKLNKITESIERLERRTVAAAAVPETTGSIGEKVPEPRQKPAILEDWVIRDVYRGRALVENRHHGIFDVGPGNTLPSVGRVETVTRRDGRWVVVTPKGLIAAAR